MITSCYDELPSRSASAHRNISRGDGRVVYVAAIQQRYLRITVRRNLSIVSEWPRINGPSGAPHQNDGNAREAVRISAAEIGYLLLSRTLSPFRARRTVACTQALVQPVEINQ
jgi:hypothetical protein